MDASPPTEFLVPFFDSLFYRITRRRTTFGANVMSLRTSMIPAYRSVLVLIHRSHGSTILENHEKWDAPDKRGSSLNRDIKKPYVGISARGCEHGMLLSAMISFDRD